MELNFSAYVSSFLPAGCLCPVLVGSRRWARLLASWAVVFGVAACWQPPLLPQWNPTETSTKPLRPVYGTTLQPSFGYWETGSNGIEMFSCLTSFPPHYVYTAVSAFFFPPVCLLSAGPVCFTQSPIWTAGIAQKDRIHETNSWDIGWLVMFNINWVYWQNEVMLQQCSVHIWTTEGSLACYRLNCHQEKNTAEHMVHLCTRSPNFTLWYQTVWVEFFLKTIFSI